MNTKIVCVSLLIFSLSCQLSGMANSEGMKKIRAEVTASHAAKQLQQPVSIIARPRIK